MTSKNEELFGRIEAEQSMILQFIEDNKRLCARSDMLVDAARKSPEAREVEGETKAAPARSRY